MILFDPPAEYLVVLSVLTWYLFTGGDLIGSRRFKERVRASIKNDHSGNGVHFRQVVPIEYILKLKQSLLNLSHI